MNAAFATAPTVSVVVPVHNVETTVAETLRSLLAQTFRDFEVIVVDDGGTDGSMEIVGMFDDPRIRIRRQLNGGLNSARNAGLRLARGRLVAFLDADDLWRPDMLARHVAHFDAHPEVGISYSPSALIGENGRSLGIRQRPKLRDIGARDVICRNPLGNGSAGVFRREVFDDVAFTDADGKPCWFDETFRQSTDIECWMRIVALSDWRFRGVPETLVQYRVCAGGLSANTERQLMFWERALAALADLRPDLAEAFGGLARAYQYRYLARRAVSARDGRGAWRFMRLALAEDARIVFQEPVKTATTLAAATALRAIS